MADRSAFKAIYRECIEDIRHVLEVFDEHGRCPPESRREAQERLKSLKVKWTGIEREWRATEVASSVLEARTVIYASAGSAPGPEWVSYLSDARDTLKYWAEH